MLKLKRFIISSLVTALIVAITIFINDYHELREIKKLGLAIIFSCISGFSIVACIRVSAFLLSKFLEIKPNLNSTTTGHNSYIAEKIIDFTGTSFLLFLINYFYLNKIISFFNHIYAAILVAFVGAVILVYNRKQIKQLISGILKKTNH